MSIPDAGRLGEMGAFIEEYGWEIRDWPQGMSLADDLDRRAATVADKDHAQLLRHYAIDLREYSRTEARLCEALGLEPIRHEDDPQTCPHDPRAHKLEAQAARVRELEGERTWLRGNLRKIFTFDPNSRPHLSSEDIVNLLRDMAGDTLCVKPDDEDRQLLFPTEANP